MGHQILGLRMSLARHHLMNAASNILQVTCLALIATQKRVWPRHRKIDTVLVCMRHCVLLPCPWLIPTARRFLRARVPVKSTTSENVLQTSWILIFGRCQGVSLSTFGKPTRQQVAGFSQDRITSHRKRCIHLLQHTERFLMNVAGFNALSESFAQSSQVLALQRLL